MILFFRCPLSGAKKEKQESPLLRGLGVCSSLIYSLLLYSLLLCDFLLRNATFRDIADCRVCRLT